MGKNSLMLPQAHKNLKRELENIMGMIKSRKGNVVYSASMSLKEAVRKVEFKDNDLKGKVREMALMLRKKIFRAKKTLLPKDLKLSDIEKGEVEIPELISIFFHNLIAGPDSRRWKGGRKAIRTQ